MAEGLRGLAAGARRLAALRALPPRVAWFHLRARRVAARSGDRFSADSAARPADVAALLELAGTHELVVELGTGTAWTAIALALARRGRRVVSYDPVVRPERERYLALVDAATRARIELRAEPAEAATPGDDGVGFVFVDCAHDEATTAAAFRAWEPAVRPGGVVAFHDYGHPDYPGVARAVAALGLSGEVRGGVLVWRKPSG